MTREDAVTYLTSLEGRVSMVVQYKREGQRKNILFFCLCVVGGEQMKTNISLSLERFYLKIMKRLVEISLRSIFVM